MGGTYQTKIQIRTYKKVGFILDRGYFSKKNIEHMDRCGYSFVIMIKGMQELVSSLILEHKGTFENKRACDMDGYAVYGKTVKRKLLDQDFSNIIIFIMTNPVRFS